LSGEEIKTYLDEVFGRRLKLGDISLVSTPKFDSAVIETYPSTILPVFVNLVDNAIHWLGLERIDSRRIKLNIDEFGFLVSNNGPAIPARLEDRIFDYGESAKPGGRGIGLYISRQALIKEKMDLQLIDLGANSGPVFRILFCVDDLRDEVST
jgi:signal transduction histidine kinase